MNELAAYGGALPGCYGPERAISLPTLKQRLELAVKEAEERLTAIREARDIFARNPDIEKLLDIMQRSHF